MPTDLHTTNIWLAVTAIAVALQTLFMFAAVIIGWRMYRKIEGAVQDLETRYVAPAEARLMAMIDDVHDITARVRRIDDTVARRWPTLAAPPTSRRRARQPRVAAHRHRPGDRRHHPWLSRRADAGGRTSANPRRAVSNVAEREHLIRVFSGSSFALFSRR